MNSYAIVLMVVISGWVAYKLHQDVSSGMRWVFGLIVFLPTWIKLDIGVADLSVHRTLILIAFVFLIRHRTPDREPRPIPHLGLVLLFGASQLISLLIGTQFVAGLKGVISYAMEVALFYVLVCRYAQAEHDIVPLLSSFCYGLAAVGVLAFIEKYKGVNLVGNSVVPSQVYARSGGDITATYPHRILLGYAMAMGAALTLVLSLYHREAKPRKVMFGITLLLAGAAYFSMSRGPWCGLAIAVLGLAALGGPCLRRKLVVTALLAGAVLVLRPGVQETIHDRLFSTFDQDSLAANSYQTRWQLWTIAWTEIQKSPERLLFGYGPVSTEHMNLEHYFYGQEGWSSSGRLLGYTSWDNNLACDLIELGIIGLALELALFAAILARLFANDRGSQPRHRILQVGIIMACLVFIFATTNVFIFSPQLKFLFWALAAIGSNLPAPVSTAVTAGAVPSLEEDPQAALDESASASHVAPLRPV